MYAGDSKVPTSVVNDSQGLNNSQSSRTPDPDHLPASESGPALEVIEMANGETIWSVTVIQVLLLQGIEIMLLTGP